MLAHVITVSDRSARGERPDASGPVASRLLEGAGWVVTSEIIPDGADAVATALRLALAGGPDLIVTCGGTGVGPRDRTPEGTSVVLDRVLPGLPELLRSTGATVSRHAFLTRGLAGVVDARDDLPGCLVVNLPGKPSAVLEGLEVLLPLVGHVLDQLAAGDH
ncbi:MAG TPA: MogA/MoaB family molybdenum cofactor biosynthesis protein [Propionibacteriaceae bacterium]|nr:MogA/MoaB family molybdenum cofactor biosynthesis protein [Propionibacteriaceae bacterium]